MSALTSINRAGPPIPREEEYNPVPPGISLPSPADYFLRLKQHIPNACGLDAVEVTKADQPIVVQMNIPTPENNISSFISSHQCSDPYQCTEVCYRAFIQRISYSVTDKTQLEVCTRGQHRNNNWHKSRKYLLTSSKFHIIIHSTDQTRTSHSLIEGSSINEQNLPCPIKYGRKYEDKARQMFFKSHKHAHKCTLRVPGLMIHDEIPYLAASPDGIINCSTCGQLLIEVKCLWSKRNFHPRVALTMSGICDSENGSLVVKKSHSYFTQMQGQMACTNGKTCYLVAFTYKGIHSVKVDFDPTFWSNCLELLNTFYRNYHFKTVLYACK